MRSASHSAFIIKAAAVDSLSPKVNYPYNHPCCSSLFLHYSPVRHIILHFMNYSNTALVFDLFLTIQTLGQIKMTAK